MLSPKFYLLLASFLLAALPAAAQLSLTYYASTAVNTSYSPPDPEMGGPASLTISTMSTPPGSINYDGASGTFTFDFLAPEGYRFVVNPLDGPVDVSFQVAYTTYNSGGAAGGLSASGSATITLLGLEGSAPTFYDNSTLGDIPHAYLSVTVGASAIAESFSFTGLRYTVNLTGTGNNLAVPYFEGGNFSVSDSTYGGPLPDANLQLLAVTTGAAVPEPATSAAVVGVVALTALGLARTMRRRTV
ncbi:MAG TPA: hypothetical protein VF388_05700 [Lacunisphaera sp.]